MHARPEKDRARGRTWRWAALRRCVSRGGRWHRRAPSDKKSADCSSMEAPSSRDSDFLSDAMFSVSYRIVPYSYHRVQGPRRTPRTRKYTGRTGITAQGCVVRGRSRQARASKHASRVQRARDPEAHRQFVALGEAAVSQWCASRGTLTPVSAYTVTVGVRLAFFWGVAATWRRCDGGHGTRRHTVVGQRGHRSHWSRAVSLTAG